MTFSFLIVHLVPGDPVRAALGARASAQSVAEWEARLGLNDPLPTQYADYVSGLSTAGWATRCSCGCRSTR